MSKKVTMDSILELLDLLLEDGKEEQTQEKKSIFDIFKSSKKEEVKTENKDYRNKVDFFNKYLFKDTTWWIMLVTDNVTMSSTKEQVISFKSSTEDYKEHINNLKSWEELTIEKFDWTQSEEELIKILSKAKAFAWNRSTNHTNENDNIWNINVITSNVQINIPTDIKYITSSYIVNDIELTSNVMSRLDLLENFNTPFWIIY